MTKPLLIVVDDDPDIGEFIRDAAELAGFEALSMTLAAQFKESVTIRCPEAVVLDLIMPDTDGIELVQVLGDLQCPSALILISGYDSKYLEMAARIAAHRGLNVVGTLSKPIRLETIESLLRLALPKSGCQAADRP